MTGEPSGERGARGRGPRARSVTVPSERSRRAEPTRHTAYELLRRVEEGAYANLELPRLLRRARLDARDSAFTTELAFGVLRDRSFLDAVITRAADRPLERIDPTVLNVLRLGAHQLLGMRVPDHAALDQTVGLARSVAGAGAVGFVNAVLRRVSEADRATWRARILDGVDGPARLALEHSHPEWIVRDLRGALLLHGASTPASVESDLATLLTSNNTPPDVALVARPGLATREELLEFVGAHPSAVSELGVVLDHGDPGLIPAVREGRAAVQDEGSQLVALALAEAPVPDGLPRRWLDLCAGPGGKSGVLGALAVREGADFTAVEVTPHRADLVRQTLAVLVDEAAAQGRSVEVLTRDGRSMGADEPGAFAKVLVDAPCTGLGALRRRPEARWRRLPSDLVGLGPLQRDLLRSALDAVAPGGLVAYSTCSPHAGETTFVVRDVLKGRKDVELIDARPFFRDPSGGVLPELGEGPTVQLWPHVHGTDAMFFALIRRPA